MLAGGDPQGCAQIKLAYASYNGTGGIAGFIAKQSVDGAIQLFSDLKAGGHARSQALLTIWYSPLSVPTTGLAARIIGGMTSKLAKVGIKVGGKTLQTWTFNTILNIEIFKFNFQSISFTFKTALVKTNIKRVLYKFENINYNTDLIPSLANGSVELVEDMSGNVGWRKVIAPTSNVFKVITTDIRTALNNRITHIRKIIFELKANGTYKFSGCHSKSALDELGNNARIEITIPANVEGVYEAKVFAKGPDGIEIPKSGNQGKSTFFPDSWDEAKILDEAEYAVKNNVGQVPASAGGAPNQYYGFSKDGKIKIEFYYDDATGNINSFFPSLKVY